MIHATSTRHIVAKEIYIYKLLFPALAAFYFLKVMQYYYLYCCCFLLFVFLPPTLPWMHVTSQPPIPVTSPVQLSKTNFSNNSDFRSFLQSLCATFKEFKMHEQIENEYIIGLLQQRCCTVYNVHSDNKLSEMLSLFEKGLHNVKVNVGLWHANAEHQWRMIYFIF